MMSEREYYLQVGCMVCGSEYIKLDGPLSIFIDVDGTQHIDAPFNKKVCTQCRQEAVDVD